MFLKVTLMKLGRAEKATEATENSRLIEKGLALINLDLVDCVAPPTDKQKARGAGSVFETSTGCYIASDSYAEICERITLMEAKR